MYVCMYVCWMLLSNQTYLITRSGKEAHAPLSGKYNYYMYAHMNVCMYVCMYICMYVPENLVVFSV